MLKIWWWFQFKPWKIILIINDCCQEVFNLIIPFLALVQYILSFPQIFCMDKKSVYKSEELKMTRAPHYFPPTYSWITFRVCAVTLVVTLSSLSKQHDSSHYVLAQRYTVHQCNPILYWTQLFSLDFFYWFYISTGIWLQRGTVGLRK